MDRKVGRYDVVGRLGEGAAGEVLHARSPDGIDVAIKVLKRGRIASGSGRFERERRLLAELGESEGFVPLLDAGEEGGRPFVVMPLVGGGTLRDRLEGPLPIPEAIALGLALARALANAHARGVVHRDLKPENVLFTREGEPLVADLGLAKHFEREGPGASVSLSRTGELHGTVGYMPAEQLADAKSVGPPADVFALGAILFECLAGRPPFVGETMVELCVRVQAGDRPGLLALRRDVPRWLAALVDKALAGEPGDRFPDGAALARALEEGLQKSKSRPSRAPLVVAALGWLAGGVALAAGAVALRRSRPEEGRPAATASPSAVSSAGLMIALAPGEGLPDETAPFRATARTRLLSAWGTYAWKHAADVRALAVLGGERALTASGDGTIAIWDLATGRALDYLEAGAGGVQALGATADGRRAVSAHDDGTLRVWDLESRRELMRLEAPGVRSLAVSADGARAVTAGGEGTLTLHDLEHGRVLAAWLAHPAGATSVALASDGESALSAGRDGLVRLWSLAAGAPREVRRFAGHEGAVWAVAFSRGAALSGGADRTLRVWDLASGAERRHYVHPDEVFSVTSLPDGSGAVTGSRDHIVRLWRFERRDLVAAFDPCPGAIRAIACLPEGARALAGDEEGSVRLVDLAGGTRAEARGHAARVNAIAVSPDGTRLATGASDRTLRLWTTAEGAETWRATDLGSLYQVAFSSDGKEVVSAGWDRGIRVRDVATGELAASIAAEAPVNGIALLRGGRGVLAADEQGYLARWEVAREERVATFEGPGDPLYCVAVTCDERRALVGDARGSLSIWDVARGWPGGRIAAHARAVHAVAYLAGGKQALSAADDGLVRLWDMERERLVRTLAGHTASVQRFALAADEKTLVTVSYDGTARVWELASGRELDRVPIGASHDAPLCVAFAPDGKSFWIGTARGVVLRFGLARE